MSNQAERQVYLGEISGESAKDELRKNAVGVDVSGAVVEYSEMLVGSLFAKYSIVDDDLVIHLFPSEKFARLSEIAVPVHPEEQRRMMAADPGVFRNYELLLQAVREEWVTVKDRWLQGVPPVLESVAAEYFQAEYPRLQAKYTQELYSWWFRAQGYGHLIDLERFVEKFLRLMDQQIQRLGN